MRAAIVSARIPVRLAKRLKAAVAVSNPYMPNRSRIIERGIELALQEMKKKKLIQ